jgi:hypothetical protein
MRGMFANVAVPPMAVGTGGIEIVVGDGCWAGGATLRFLPRCSLSCTRHRMMWCRGVVWPVARCPRNDPSQLHLKDALAVSYVGCSWCTAALRRTAALLTG